MKTLIIVMCAVLAIFIVVSCTTNTGAFLLVNMAKEPIVNAVVTVSGQTIELKNIQPTKSVKGFYKVKFDSHYKIKIEFQSGRKLEKNVGYVTNGLDFKHEITITDTDIEITSNKAMLREVKDVIAF